MAGQTQLTFLLVIIACMVHGAPLIDEQSDFVQDLEIRANLDKTVDALLPSIRKLILNNGMDPMQILDISENIFPDLPSKFKGNIDLKKGWLQNLSLMKRSQHVIAIYKNKRLTMDMNFAFDVMDTSYEYHLQHLLYKREGDVYGRLYQADINIVVTVDLNEYLLILDSIKFTNVRKFDIKFQGHIVDHLLNAVTKVVTTIFRNRVLKIVEDYAMWMFGVKIDEWNKMIPRPNRTEIIDSWLDIVKTKLY